MDSKRPAETAKNGKELELQKQKTAGLASASSCKPIAVYEILNKIQHVINSESAIPQFIYFARKMEEMREKWLQAERKLAEYEKRLQDSSMEKKILQNQLTELKIDIEIHNEKRQQAENERDRLAKQIDLFKKILDGNRIYGTVGEEYLQMFAAEGQLGGTHGVGDTAQGAKSPNRRSVDNMIDDTGFMISDYTADDIDLGANDAPNTAYFFASPRNSGTNEEETNMLTNVRTAISDGKDRHSLTRKRNQRQSTSLTRNGDAHGQKRSRTRSTDMVKDALVNGITTITTLKIGEDGGPITLTSEIKQQSNEANQRLKNRKKRPSREFLQRSADESESTEDSEVFWNGSEDVAAEAARSNQPPSNQQQPSSYSGSNSGGVHVMTPIIEAPTPTSSSYSRHQFSRQALSGTPCKAPASSSSGSGSLKALSANSIPLARKYKKAHVFKGQVILNSELCAHCDKRTKFGKMIMKCRECELVVHTECKDLLQRPYFAASNLPAQGSISDYAPDESPRVPPLVQMIVNEIEARGLTAHEVGLYRVNGSDTQIKQFKERLFKRHQVPDLRKIADIHVLCSFLKDFLNNLNEHLITYDAWYRFAKACDIQNETDRLTALQQAVEDLPTANRDTLAFIVLHLQRVSVTAECKMPASNLARVFGPSLVGNSSSSLVPAQIINELKIQQQIVENLIKIPAAFYTTFVEGVDQQQRLFKNPPKTPETMRKSKTAVVLSSILGPAANVQLSSNYQGSAPTSSSLSNIQNRH